MKRQVEISSEQVKVEKICGVIFSRDRAMQLEGLLRSLLLHCGDINRAQITVLYKATNEYHARQYQKLANEYAGRILFKNQQYFRQDTLAILTPFEKNKNTILFAIGAVGFSVGSLFDRIWRRTFGQIQIFLTMILLAPGISSDSYVLFLVDDNIFVRDFLFTDIIDALKTCDDLIGFSLRIGENTTYCYSQNHSQALPDFIPISKDRVKYDWTRSKYDFGYPLEISSSVYRLKDIFPFISGLPFENPNVLEERMAFYANKFADKYSLLGCYRLSVTFCNPVNMVQSIIPNRAGEEFQYDTNELAARFERRERIKVEAYNGFIPNACHQEVEYVFEKHEN